MHWHWEGHHWGWMLLWWVFLAAVAAGIIWALVILARRRSGTGEETPEQVLKRRYARGEIDHETYERTLQDLKK